MAGSSFEHAAEARAALHAIVTDPAHGVQALDSPERTANLLHDFLPDAPREAGLLVAAVSVGLPAALRGYAAQHIDPATAVRLAAASLAGRTAFTPEACEWVAAELAIAIGLQSADKLAIGRGAAEPVEAAPLGEASAPKNSMATQPLTLGISQPDLAAAAVGSPRNWRRRTLVLGLAVLALAAGVGFGVGYMYSRHPSTPAASSQRPTAPSAHSHKTTPAASSHRTTTQCKKGALSNALIAANPQLKSLSWHIASYACRDAWAAATVYAPAVGGGEAFLLYAASGWSSGALNGGVYSCSDPGAAFTPPVPPQALAVSLFNEVGLCATSSATQCGTTTTAADVAVTVEVVRGPVSCSTAMTIEREYAAALRSGAAPGNGGGGPINVQGWTCQGFATPYVIRTGKASECIEGASKILTVLPS